MQEVAGLQARMKALQEEQASEGEANTAELKEALEKLQDEVHL